MKKSKLKNAYQQLQICLFHIAACLFHTYETYTQSTYYFFKVGYLYELSRKGSKHKIIIITLKLVGYYCRVMFVFFIHFPIYLLFTWILVHFVGLHHLH